MPNQTSWHIWKILRPTFRKTNYAAPNPPLTVKVIPKTFLVPFFPDTVYTANIDTLASRRNDLSKKFFRDITQPSSCLHCLLPAPREQSIISRPRTPAKYPRVHTHTKCYCSFINYAHNNYQDSIDKAPNK